MIRHATLQRGAEIAMVLGIVALCQPWNLLLHRYGLTVVIVGLLTFMFTGWFGPKGNITAASETDAVFDVSDHRDGQNGASPIGDAYTGGSDLGDGPVGDRA